MVPFLTLVEPKHEGLFTPVTFLDMPESPHLNHQCKLIVGKFAHQICSGNVVGLSLRTSGSHPQPHAFHAKDGGHQATRKGRGQERQITYLQFVPSQQALFTKLCTTHMQEEPVMPNFLTLCLDKKTPLRATNLIAHKSRKWKGTFFTSGLTRLVVGGYISQEGSQGGPCGFTVFMLHPWLPHTKGTLTELAIKGRGRIRDFFALDADKDTLKF
jgi:hypothetical protein